MTVKFSVSNSETVSKYTCKNHVVRRGETITLELSPIKHFDENKLSFEWSIFGKSVYSDLISYNEAKISEEKWSIKCEKTDAEVKIIINTPVGEEVGLYDVIIKYKSSKIDEFQFAYIFNPWNIKDEAYMRKKSEKDEYIMNEKTVICVGSARYFSKMYWDLCQFSKHSMKCLLFILEKHCSRNERKCPSLSSRVITQLVNANDDNGILIGNWSGNYEDGTPPGSWRDSDSILKEYNLSKRSVKYGQCFIFAAVNCTLLRACGIACRVITNFDSLHDGDKSINMEIYYDKDHNVLNDLCKDSIWNFHVWNEIWIRRSDIKSELNGWNVVDATPQERSDNYVFTCGPSPVKAVKQGILDIPFDTAFVYSEVNGKKIYFCEDENGKFVKVGEKSNIAGNGIYTKCIGSFNVYDISEDYKPKKTTTDTREVERNIESWTDKNKNVYPSLDIYGYKYVNLGDDLTFSANYISHVLSKGKAKIHVCLAAYNGRIIGKISEKECSFDTNSSQKLVVSAEELYKNLTPRVESIKIYGTVYTENGYTDYDELIIELNLKKVIKILSVKLEEDTYLVKLKVLNSLPYELKKNKILVFGPCLKSKAEFEVKNIPAFGTEFIELKVKASKHLLKSSQMNVSIHNTNFVATTEEFKF